MKIGIPKEIKVGEGRIAMVPSDLEELISKGHDIFIEKGSGIQSGYPDSDYESIGVKIIQSKQKLYEISDVLVKVKEPILDELKYFSPGPVLFSFLHLAANENLTNILLNGNSTAIAFESIEDKGGLPILMPMSEVAGRMASIIGSNLLAKKYGGSGVLLGGASGIHHGYTVVIGGGTAGKVAALTAYGLGSHVIILEKNLERIRYLSDILPSGISVINSNPHNIRESLKLADLLIGTVLIPNTKAPRLVSKEMVETMKNGSVIIDISIDQGGCIETSHPTTHDDPIFIHKGIIHYCVTNMPGAFPKTSAEALSEHILPYLKDLVSQENISSALKKYIPLRKGTNILDGKITIKPIAENFGYNHFDIDELLF